LLFRVRLQKEDITMKRVRKTITADTQEPKHIQLSTEARYSNADVYVLLMTIVELQGQTISAVENEDGSCDFTIGNTIYSIATTND